MKREITIILLMIILGVEGVFSEKINERSLEADASFLQTMMEVSEERAKEKDLERFFKNGSEELKDDVKTEKKGFQEKVKEEGVVREADLDAILKEVESLKAERLERKLNNEGKDKDYDQVTVGNQVVYKYNESKMFQIRSTPGMITNLLLEPGEYLIDDLKGSDTTRWIIDGTKSNSQDGMRNHLLIEPMEKGLRSVVLLSTNKRSYLLELLSGSNYVPTVKWTYGANLEIEKLKIEREKRERELYLDSPPEEHYRRYVIKGDDQVWRPLSVFDDGKFTYLYMNPEMTSYESPTIFIMDDDDKPILISPIPNKSRKLLGEDRNFVYTITRIAKHIQLRVGKKKIDIYRGREVYKKKTSWWERNF